MLLTFVCIVHVQRTKGKVISYEETGILRRLESILV